MNKLMWVLRIAVAVILIQTLRFKFTAHPDSVFIFTQVGMEPWGRILVGISELIAAVLILIPATVAMGSVLTMGIIGGAIVMHLTILGIEVNGDISLFLLALVTFTLATVVTVHYRAEIPFVGSRLAGKQGTLV
jgi:putative oxidoreductase